MFRRRYVKLEISGTLLLLLLLLAWKTVDRLEVVVVTLAIIAVVSLLVVVYRWESRNR